MKDYYLNVAFGHSPTTTNQFVDLLLEDQCEFPTEDLIKQKLKDRGYAQGRVYNLSFICYCELETA